jgi:succinyl-diaminopimelate desuccinylase
MAPALVETEALAAYSPEEVELVRFVQEAVATPSLTGEEAAVARMLADRLERLGYRDVEVDEHGNVVARLGQGPDRLMFNGHLDHVPPAGMEDPYDSRLVEVPGPGGPTLAIRGRGTCDMKANVMAGAFAAAFLDRDRLTGGTFVFTADVQEETDSPVGVPSLLERGIRAEYGISSESTQLGVYLGHRGKIQVDVRVAGRSSHASTPGDGLNAVYRAVPFLQAFEAMPSGLPADELFGAATLTVTGISSEPTGDVAVVPSACTIRLDRRYVPGETPEGCLEEISRTVARVAAESGFEATAELVNVYPLMSIEPDHELVRKGIAAVESVTGETPRVGAWRFGVNATFMAAAGIPTIGIGPGNEDFAHTRDEHVPVDELVRASRIYARLIEDLCGGEEAR